MGSVDGGARGGVHLGGVVQFDDFRGFEVFGGLGGKVVGQHSGNREVGGDEHLLGFGLGPARDGFLDLGELLISPASGADHHIHALANQGKYVVQADGRYRELDHDISVVGGDPGQVVTGVQSKRQLCVRGVVHCFDHIRAIRPLAPTTETLIIRTPCFLLTLLFNRQSAITSKASRQYPRPSTHAVWPAPNQPRPAVLKPA